MGDDQITVDDEPASPATAAGDAGSSHLVPTATADVLRAITCAALVAVCVGSPASAPLIGPFVPALVAIRWLRARRGRVRFLVLATGLAVMGAVLAAPALPGGTLLGLGFAAAMTAALVPGLGTAHARAARPDAVVVEPDPWPEPTLRSGLAPALGAWCIAVVGVLACAAPLVDSVRELERREVRDAYGLYVRECRNGGAFEDRADFCEQTLAQRDAVVEVIDDHALDVLSAVAALIAFGGAATTHLVVLARARRSAARVRPGWKLRELEVHWSAAYLVVVGVAAWLLARGDGPVVDAIRAMGVGVGLLGVLLVLIQGVGLAAWLLTRGRTPGWYRAFLVVAALFVLRETFVVVFGLGVLDQALQPRRRALRSGSFQDRGSGS